jgi:sulfide:quinone oxidoreductase
MTTLHGAKMVFFINDTNNYQLVKAVARRDAGYGKIKDKRADTTWLKDAVKTFSPETNMVTLVSGNKLEYDYLIVAPGIQLNWNEVKGLMENLGKNGVCSNYDFRYADYTWECIQKTKSGRAIFTNPHTPVKCGGAPQKIMYLATDYFAKQGIADKIQAEMWTGGTRVFGVPKYEEVLKKIIEKRKGNRINSINECTIDRM